MENTDPRPFTNVRVFAGDKFKPAADASYRNFHAGPGFNIGSNVRENNEIGTIDNWGPLFRVSLDLIIHSYHRRNEWSSVLAFIREREERIPGIFVHKDGYLHFFDYDYDFNYEINLNTWYDILIEQKILNRQVR